MLVVRRRCCLLRVGVRGGGSWGMGKDGCCCVYCCCPPSLGASLSNEGDEDTFVAWSCVVRLVRIVGAARDLLDNSVA